MGCNICSESHETETCQYNVTTKIKDRTLPKRAFATLPKCFLNNNGEDKADSFEVLVRSELVKGTQFGPFDAPKHKKFNPSCSYKLAVS